MKHFFYLILSLVFFISCDDGDLITQNFNFETATIQKCDLAPILFKINDNEALILNTPANSIENKETPLNSPRIINIGGTTSLTYKKFNSIVTESSICGTPTVLVVEDWNVSGGTVEVTTNKILGTDNITIIGYNHNIVFKNVTFVTNNKQVTYPVYVFGNYRTDVIDLQFDFVSSVTQECTNNNLIFKYNTTKVLLLDLDTTLFTNVVTPVGFPRTALINSTTNKVIYREYNGNLNTAFFCSTITPIAPTLSQEWIADDGVASTSGIIKVTTELVTLTPPTYRHTIVLNKTVFRNGIETYSPAPNGDYTFGELITY